jgi:anhydro-N-acetylmuramic acid kinase
VLDALWLGRDDAATGGSGAQGSGLTAALNIGGIANVSLVGRIDDPVTGWDTGPGNCLLDVAVTAITDGRLAYDEDGKLAAQGTVDPGALAALLDDPYFAAPAPKSTGREHFDTTYTARRLASVRPGLTGPDLVATLTELTAVSVADALAGCDVRRVVASGGGARNPVLLDRLRVALAARVPHACDVVTSDALGLPVDAKEAYLFALLGFLSAHGLPGTAAGEHRRRATGARRAVVLGSLTPPTPLPWPAASGPVRRLALANTPHGLQPGPRTKGPLSDPTKGSTR